MIFFGTCSGVVLSRSRVEIFSQSAASSVRPGCNFTNKTMRTSPGVPLPWKYRVAEHEAGNDVTTAADAGQMHIRLDLPVDVIEAVIRERASRRQNRLQLR